MKRKLIRLINGSSIVHAYGSTHLSWAAYEAAKSLYIRFIVTPVAHPGQYGDGPLDIELYKKANVIIAWLAKEKEFYVSKGVDEKKVHLIGFPNCIEWHSRNKKKPLLSTDIREEDKIILYVGRISRYKGVDKLVETAKFMPREKFVFIGPMEDKALFNDKTTNVIYLGPLVGDSLWNWYTKADVICLISKHEIVPNVILEAWQFRKPVVVSDIPYLRCLVDNGINGIVVSDRISEIKSSIEKVLMSKTFAAALGEAGYRKWQENYTPEIVKAKIIKLYKQLIDKKTQHKKKFFL